jgi:predicted TIM-barrel fold metal-dependent hydrolase
MVTPVIDTHRHPFGKGEQDIAVSVGAYDPAKPLPQATAGQVLYAEWLDEETTVAGQRDGGVTRAILSNGGELEFFSQLSGGDARATAQMMLDEKLGLIERHPDDFGLMVDADPFDHRFSEFVIAGLEHHGACAISVATSWGDGEQRRFLDDPAAEWLWRLAVDRGVAVHLHPPMMPCGHESQFPYRLAEVVGRPCDTALTIARMIYSGVFDRYPGLQVMTVHTGGAVPAIVGRLDFGWRVNFNGVADRASVADVEDRNALMPSEYLRRNVWADVMGLSAPCVTRAIEVYGIDHITFGTDYGPVPISPREHLDMVLSLGLSDEHLENVLWRNADAVLSLGVAHERALHP